MRWIEDKLEPTEEIIFETRNHWSIFLLPMTLLLMALFDAWFLFPAIGLLLYDLYQFLANHFVVTNQRLIHQKGIYYIRTRDWPLLKIDNVICIRTFADRLFGTGSVILFGLSIPKSRLNGVGHPYDLRNAIYSQLPTK